MKNLSDLLSYEVPGAFFAKQNVSYQWDGRHRLLKKTKDGYASFPTGLLQRVEKFLKLRSIRYQVEDTRTVPGLAREFGWDWEHEPHYYQKDARDATEASPRGVFHIGTGGGKTVLSSLIVDKKGVQTLFATPDIGLREQAYERYCEFFSESDVTKDIEDLKSPIVIANIQGLVNKKPKLFERFRMLMIDEFHHAAADSYLKLNQMSCNAFYRYGFTGTFLRTDGTDMSMHGVLSELIYKKTTSELIEEGFLVRPYITIYRYQTKMPGRCAYQTAYKSITEEIPLQELIAKITNEKIAEGKQSLVLVRRVEHGEALSNLIPEAVYLDGSASIEHREKVKADFAKKKVKCIIATKIFGEGTDVPAIDFLANARFQKTEIETMQGIGRALRKSPGKTKAEIVDFLIVGQKHLTNHSIERINSYKKEPAFRIKVVRA